MTLQNAPYSVAEIYKPREQSESIVFYTTLFFILQWFTCFGIKKDTRPLTENIMSDTATLPTTQTWNLDTSHSSIDFKVKHMAISTVRGNFKTFSGTIHTNNGELSNIETTIDVSSVSTNDEKRDGHLKSPDFFDVANAPSITFKSTKIEKVSDGQYRVTGDLTMRGVTKSVIFNAETSAPVKDPWGLTRAAANIQGKLNRKDWGLNWNQVLELGALLVGEEVMFDFDVEAVAQA